MTNLRTMVLLGLAGLAGIAAAQTPAPAPAPAPATDAAAKDVPIPPKKPPPAGDEGSAPTVTIRNTDSGDRVEEYRQNGQVFMVKVVPKNGVTYYLYDDDRNGRLDRTDADGKLSPVYYTIYEWDASKPKPARKD